MKVIDLLNKIANSEEIPKHIKYKNFNFYFDACEYRDFYEEITYFDLNDEVEIIEEEQDIEELRLMFPICNDIKNAELGGFASIYKSNLENIKYKIDELVKVVNELKNGSR